MADGGLMTGLAATGAVVAGISAYGAKAMNAEGNDTFEKELEFRIKEYKLDKERHFEQQKQRLEQMIKKLQEEKAKCENKKPVKEAPSIVEAVTGEPAKESEVRAAEPAGSGLAGLVGALTGTPAAAPAPAPAAGLFAAPGTAVAPAAAPAAGLFAAPGTAVAPAAAPAPAPAAGLFAAPGTAAAAAATGSVSAAEVAASAVENLGKLYQSAPSAVSPEEGNVSTAAPGLFQDGQAPPQPIRTPGFIEPQEEGSLGCGRHALNNFLGGRNFMKDNGTNIQSIAELTLPVSLQTLCRYITPPGEQGYCPDNEFYEYEVLRAGLNLFGYEVDPLNYSKGSLPADAAGFLIRKRAPEHWFVFRKEEGDTFTMLDSLNPKPDQRPLTALEKDYLGNVGKENTNDSIYTIRETGETRDIKPGIVEAYGTPSTLEQRLEAAKARAAAMNVNTTPSTGQTVMSVDGESRVGQAAREANPIRKEAQFPQDTTVQTSPGKAAATLASQPSNNRLEFGTSTANVPVSQSSSSTGATRLTRKKKLRTRRATKQKNVGRTRSR
jgi:hypothetical protein